MFLRQNNMIFFWMEFCAALGYVYAYDHFPIPKQHADMDWFDAGQKELQNALKTKYNTNVAKNVIFFLGDGMSFNTVWAARIYIGQTLYGQSGEEHQLEFEKFPHIAASKTYNVDQQIPDSAGTATAFLCGVKANAGTVGVNHKVKRSNCSNQEENKVTSILDWSMEAGKATGIVTTARITHATPSAAYAHSAERNWENDSKLRSTKRGVPSEYNEPFKCKDIAAQLVEENANINVLLGGGRRSFRSSSVVDEEYPEKFYQREDGRDLIQEWIDEKDARNAKNAFAWNKEQFDAVDPIETDYLLGLFEPSHMQYELDKNATAEPTLAELTRKAIQILQKDEDGFFLLVEGGRIDHAHHYGRAKRALDELRGMDEAVRVAKEMTNDEDTLVIVTSDHSHAFTSGGYTTRGLDILGFGDNWEDEAPSDGLPFTTLAYGNGPGRLPVAGSRPDLTGTDTHHKDYRQQSAIPMDFETHGGEEVPIYASGPMAHLFHKTHEQNYIAHVMAYASCVGDNTGHCDGAVAGANGIIGRSWIMVMAACVCILLIS